MEGIILSKFLSPILSGSKAEKRTLDGTKITLMVELIRNQLSVISNELKAKPE